MALKGAVIARQWLYSDHSDTKATFTLQQGNNDLCAVRAAVL
jgi:hypothetical protein